MSETKKLKQTPNEKKQTGQLGGWARLFLGLILLIIVVYIIAPNFSFFVNIFLALVGLGAMVLVHEFGHFVVAKLSDIKVEAFSIGFPPTLAGIRRTQQGYKVRILPQFFPSDKNRQQQSEDENWDEGRLSFTIGKKSKAGETEYRVGLIPFGGFVKMLGQEDVGATKSTDDDPRSYANKSVWARMAVISAGVVFNIIGAVVVFMLVFLIGIQRTPAVIGGVMPGSPAAKAGLKSGDEIIEIAGKTDNLEFSDIMLEAALSAEGEQIHLKAMHEDGTIEEYWIVAESIPGVMDNLKVIGIFAVETLTIADISDANALYEKTGLRPGDKIKSVNGKRIQWGWELDEEIENARSPEVQLLVERVTDSGKNELIKTEIPLYCGPASQKGKSGFELSHIYSMVPRLRISSAQKTAGADSNEPVLKSGDIIVSIGDVNNPTYKQLREVTEEHKDKELVVKVLRQTSEGSEKEIIVTTVPKLRKSGGVEKVIIGIIPVLDMEHPVIAQTISVKEGPEKLDIPPGATITAVDGVKVSSFYDVAAEIRKYPNERIVLDYRLNDETAGSVALEVANIKKNITVQFVFAEVVPLKPLTKLYKAAGPVDAIGMGFKKTGQFIIQAYLTLRRFVGGEVSAENFRGPVGIIELGYQVVKRYSLIYYAYVLGLMSAFIAVINFLPMLPFDGGHVVFLLIEKIKGSPVNERIQSYVASVGWILVGALAIYVTYNDIVRIVKGFLSG